jgi:CRP-like cAMP-binding protein
MRTAIEVTDNHLLAALPDEELRRWLPLLEPVEMPLGMVLYESGRAIDHVFFPTTAVVSLSYVLADGHTTEFSGVGSEGVVGISLFMGGDRTCSRAVVQGAGRGYQLGSRAIKEAFDRSEPVRRLMLRYTQALISQTAQTAVCIRHHTLDERLCRWLLSSFDRLVGNELLMTQELIADVLGVRREGVTEAALRLQAAGLIRYARGHITVLDRYGLERRTCECYEVVKKEYDRLLPDLRAARKDRPGSVPALHCGRFLDRPTGTSPARTLNALASPKRPVTPFVNRLDAASCRGRAPGRPGRVHPSGPR